ncbi:endolytic transglycosylase MltG [Aminipila butyrica]|uniref:Endolytic murein transglycosylase n=1 Tax=Aminipila butyrica TaxID=433296 RepID=A0A858BWJ0_9FIRM|nr:endolytic transglycosylase MltG [Aminipila butyrica]QIB69445.1 endolytic transglycosylase MltG [Aminipila butyrica]
MGKKRRRHAPGKKYAGGLLLIILLLLGLSIWYVSNLGKPLNAGDTQVLSVNIPQGSGTSNIGQILQEEQIIASAGRFQLLSKIDGNDGKYKAGEYSLSPSMTLQQIMDIIISGDSSTSRFTIPEGLTVKETAERLHAQNFINQEAFFSEVQSGSFDYKFMELLPPGENRLEGFLYPETYDIYTTASEHDIIQKMLSQFDKLVGEEYYARAQEMGYSMYQIVTIASLIEKETLVSAERPTVASVIYNRMAINMPLQIDAAVQYALPEHKSRLTNKDLQVDSPYNTYQNTGLPPGPICSPGIDSIEAALYPASTNYYYYVLSADQNGTHKFSNTYEEFMKNKKAYIKSL